MPDRIDYESIDPPYLQLAAILRRRIEDGAITARLPGERDLHAEFGVAVVTARKAVRVLAQEGLVRTVRGWGTYVVTPGELATNGLRGNWTSDGRAAANPGR